MRPMAAGRLSVRKHGEAWIRPAAPVCSPVPSPPGKRGLSARRPPVRSPRRRENTQGEEELIEKGFKWEADGKITFSERERLPPAMPGWLAIS